jgi:hypothetical protein
MVQLPLRSSLIVDPCPKPRQGKAAFFADAFFAGAFFAGAFFADAFFAAAFFAGAFFAGAFFAVVMQIPFGRVRYLNRLLKQPLKDRCLDWSPPL